MASSDSEAVTSALERTNRPLPPASSSSSSGYSSTSERRHGRMGNASVAVPLITPRYQRKSRFYRNMQVTDSVPDTQTPGDALSQQSTEEMTIENGPMRYNTTVHFHTYDLFRHGKRQIHSRSVGYSSDGDLVMMREDLSEVSDVDTITKRKTMIYEPTVLNPRAQAPLTDSELQSRYYRRFKKKYPGIKAPRNKKIRNRLMNDFFASEDAKKILDKTREYRETEEGEESVKPFFGPLPKELESTFDVLRDDDAKRYWTPHQKPIAPPHPDSAEARLQLLNTRLRGEIQRAFNSEFLARQIEDLEATFSLHIRRGEVDTSLVFYFRDGYGRLVCHGIAAYYSLLSKTVASETNGKKLTYVSFPKGRKGVPHIVPLPNAPLSSVLGPCSLPRHSLSPGVTPVQSPELEPASGTVEGLEPLPPLDLGEGMFSALLKESGATETQKDSAAQPASEDSLWNTTVVVVTRGEVCEEDAVPLYAPQLYMISADENSTDNNFRIVDSPPDGSAVPMTQTQRKKLRRAEKALQAEAAAR